MTADASVYRYGKLCISLHESIERELRGRVYQAELRVARLRSAWPDPDKRSGPQDAAINRAALYAVSCRAALEAERDTLRRIASRQLPAPDLTPFEETELARRAVDQ